MDFSKIIILVIFVLILGALGSAMFSLVKGGGSRNMARSLTWRIGLSIGLFALLFILYGLGVIQPHGLGR